MKDCGVLGYEWTDDATVHSMSSQSRCNPQFHQVPAPSLLHLKQPTCRWGPPYNLQATCYVLTVCSCMKQRSRTLAFNSNKDLNMYSMCFRLEKA